MDCLFCAIAAGEIPSKKVYEDEYAYAFWDINPSAAVHILVIPKKHITSFADINEGNIDYIKHVLLAAGKSAELLGLSEGYRVITNCGDHGAQSVPHLHFHILGGEKLPTALC